MLAMTLPVIVPSGRAVGVGDSTGVEEVGVAVSTGVEEVAVGDSTGVSEVGVVVPLGVSEVAVGVSTGVEDVGVGDSTGVSEVAVGVSTGVEDVGVGDSTGVSEVGVGVSKGVGVKLGVGSSPTTVRLVPVDEILVSRLSPLDTRAVHSIAVCPAWRPLALNVKAAPPAMALLPLLPAIATMKLPFCGSLTATAGSDPNRLVAAILLICTKAAL